MASKGRGGPAWQHKQKRHISKSVIYAAGTKHIVIPGLPAAETSGHAEVGVRRIVAALKTTPEEMTLHIQEIILLHNTVWLLMQKYPEHKSEALQELNEGLRGKIEEVRVSKEVVRDEMFRTELVRLVADLSGILGTLPAVRVAKCEIQAAAWMKKKSGKKNGT